jgi:hypothetical protein
VDPGCLHAGRTPDFQIVDDRCAGKPVPPGGCSVAVVFAPSSVGPRTAALSFVGGPCVGTLPIALSGAGGAI